MTKIVIITGGSKGIGLGIAKAYSSEGYRIFSIARSRSYEEKITEIQADLSHPEEAEKALSSLLKELLKDEISQITLINNAGRLGKISKVEDTETADITETFLLNTVSPMALSGVFIQGLEQLNCPKTILMISSGAAQKPYHGWAAYCASKAALDMLTNVLAVEQQSAQFPVRVLSISPGVVDTAMQSQIRTSNAKDFASIQRFLELKNNNQLTNALDVGKKIYAIDQDNANFQSGMLVDIRKV